MAMTSASEDHSWTAAISRHFSNFWSSDERRPDQDSASSRSQVIPGPQKDLDSSPSAKSGHGNGIVLNVDPILGLSPSQKKRRPQISGIGPEEFVIVRPPPKQSNHPLSIQLQWVPGRRRRKSANTGGDDGVTANGTHQSQTRPSSPNKSEEEHVTFGDEGKGKLQRSSSIYTSLSTAWDSRTSVSRRSSVSSQRSSRSRPLYQVDFHTVKTTTITRFEDDTRLAKVSRRGLEIAHIGVLEPEEISADASILIMPRRKVETSLLSRRFARSAKVVEGGPEDRHSIEIIQVQSPNHAVERTRTGQSLSDKARMSTESVTSKEEIPRKKTIGARFRGLASSTSKTKSPATKTNDSTTESAPRVSIDQDSLDIEEPLRPKQGARFVWRFRSRVSTGIDSSPGEICFEWREKRASDALDQFLQAIPSASRRTSDVAGQTPSSPISDTGTSIEGSEAGSDAHPLDRQHASHDETDLDLPPTYICQIHLGASPATQIIPVAILSTPTSSMRASVAHLVVLHPMPDLTMSSSAGLGLHAIDISECVLCMSLWLVLRTSYGILGQGESAKTAIKDASKLAPRR